MMKGRRRRRVFDFKVGEEKEKLDLKRRRRKNFFFIQIEFYLEKNI